MKSIASASALAALFLSTGLCAAPQPNNNRPPEIAPPMVVTADRIDLGTNQAVAPVVLISKQDIELNQTPNVGALLRSVAGIDVAQSGGPGQATSIFMRGAGSNQTLVLLDGVAIMPGTAGGAALQNIGTQNIQRVEIIKGPRSSLYGSGAIGGIINIVTTTPKPGTHVDAALKYGSFNTRKASAAISHAGTQWFGGANASHSESDGIPAKVGANKDTGYDNTTLNVFGGWHGERTNVQLRHWQTRGTTQYLGFLLLPKAQDYANRISVASFDTTPSEDWHTTVKVSHFYGEINQRQTPDFQHTKRWGFDWRNNLALDEHNRLVIGTHFKHTQTASLSVGTPFNESHSTKALYAQDDTVFGAHHFVVAARAIDDDRFGGHVTGNIDYGYQLTDATRLTAGYGTAFHAPTSVQRFGFGANPNLDPETSKSYELGLRQSLGEHQQLTVNLYQNDVDDLIVYDFASAHNQNIDTARTRGLEAIYDLTTPHWHWRVAATRTQPHNADTGEYLLRRTRISGSSTLDYFWGGHTVGLKINANGPRRDYIPALLGNGRNAGYVIVNLHSRWQLGTRWTLLAKVANAFDTDYSSVAGYQSPGLSAYVTLQYGWDSQ